MSNFTTFLGNIFNKAENNKDRNNAEYEEM